MRKNDASRIIDVIDQRIAKKTASESRVETTWGTVAAVDASGRYADLYLYGNSAPYSSEYFRLPNGMSVSVGDSVKAAIDKDRGDRWVEEAHSFATYNKVEFDIVGGEVRFGSGSSPASARLHSPADGSLTVDGGDDADITLNFVGTWRQYSGGDSQPYVLIAPGSGIQLGAGGGTAPDVKMFRQGMGILYLYNNGVASPTQFGVQSKIGANGIVSSHVDGDTAARIAMFNGGDGNGAKIEMGPGDTSRDIRLRRDTSTDAPLVFDRNGQSKPTWFALRSTSGQRVYVDLAQGGDTVARLMLSGDTTLTGIEFGSGSGSRDVNLYRSAANELSTDDKFRINDTTDLALAGTTEPFRIGPANGVNLAIDVNEIMARNNGATSDLNLQNEGGRVTIDGSANPTSNAHGLLFGNDVNLWRSAADTLRTNDGFWPEGGLILKTKAGTPTDADLVAGMTASGAIILDTSASKLWCRVGTTWKSVTLT